MDDVFAMQERLSRAIVDALRVQLSVEEAGQRGPRRPRDLRTYEIFVRARREIWHHFAHDAFDQARQLVTRGLELSPDDADLWATLSYIEWLAYGGAVEGTSPDALRRFGEAAERAVALDPQSALAWFARGRFAMNVGQGQKAAEFLRRSVEIEPSGDGYALLALMLGYLGGEDEAVSSAARAVAIDPLTPAVVFWSAAAMCTCGRSDEAVRLSDTIDDWVMDFSRGLSQVQQGDRAGAIRSFERLGTRPGGAGDFGRIWLAALGQRPFAPLAPATKAALLTEVGLALYAAEAFAAGGQREDALFWTRVAIFNGFRNVRFLTETSPNFATLRDDPEFETLVAIAQGQQSVWREPTLEGPWKRS